jgi:RNA-binding protein
MTLTSREIRHLRGLSHKLHPVVTVGEKGLSGPVMAEIESALEHHELIKVKLRSDRDTRASWVKTIAAASGAELVHAIGQVACFFRRNADQPVIDLPDPRGGGARRKA